MSLWNYSLSVLKGCGDWWSSRWLEERQCHNALQEGQEGLSGELQAYQSNLSPLEDYQEILKAISMLKVDKVIWKSQHILANSKSCLTNLIAVFDEMTSLVDGEGTVNVIFLDFSKAFNIVSHSILVAKSRKHGLDEWTTTWVNNLTRLSGSEGTGQQSKV